MMLFSKILAAVTLITLTTFHTLAAEEYINLTPYPKGKSYSLVVTENIIKHFDATFQKQITYGTLPFALMQKLPKSRLAFRINQFPHPPTIMQKKLQGATIDYLKWTITTKYGETISLGIDGPKGKLVPIPFANYDQKIGLTYSFNNLPFKAYFAPMTFNNLRTFTINQEDIYWDKTYLELDHAQRKLQNIDFYYALMDIFIAGDFDIAKTLTQYEQELLIDNLSIGLAEYYLHRRKLGNDIDELNGNPFGREAPPLFNAILQQFYNRGGKQLYLNDQNKFAIREKSRMKYFYGRNGGYMAGQRILNEKIITAALRKLSPQSFTSLDKALNKKYSDNLFNMIAYIGDKPKHYTPEVRSALQQIISALYNNNINKINKDIELYTQN